MEKCSCLISLLRNRAASGKMNSSHKSGVAYLITGTGAGRKKIYAVVKLLPFAYLQNFI